MGRGIFCVAILPAQHHHSEEVWTQEYLISFNPSTIRAATTFAGYRVRYSTLLDQPSSSKCSTGTVSDSPNMPRRVIVEKVPPFRPIWRSEITHNASP